MSKSERFKIITIVLTRHFDRRLGNKVKRRAAMWGWLIRWALRRGCTVCIAGPTGTGKTLLLDRAVRGNVISAAGPQNNFAVDVEFEPHGPITGITGIDETGYFAPDSLSDWADELQRYGVVYTAQRPEMARRLAKLLKAKNLLLIWTGEDVSLKIGLEVSSITDNIKNL